ncbi:hypothetical protein D3C75_609900 [compost metagenome]
MDGADAGAHDFGHIGAGEDGQRRYPGGESVEVEHSADKEIDDEDLHQQRGAANELHIGDRQVAQGGIGGEAGEARQGAQQDGEDARHQGELDRDPDAPGDGAGGPAQLHIQGVTEEDGIPFGNLGACAGDGLATVGVEIVLQEELALLCGGGASHHCAVKFCVLFLFGLVGDVLGNAFPAPGVIHRLHGLVDAKDGGQQHQQENPVPEQQVGLFFHLSCDFGVDHCHNLSCRYCVGSA